MIKFEYDPEVQGVRCTVKFDDPTKFMLEVASMLSSANDEKAIRQYIPLAKQMMKEHSDMLKAKEDC